MRHLQSLCLAVAVTFVLVSPAALLATPVQAPQTAPAVQPAQAPPSLGGPALRLDAILPPAGQTEASPRTCVSQESADVGALSDPCLPECFTSKDCNSVCPPCPPFVPGICENEDFCHAFCYCFCG